jgi:hypothetical protein
MGRSENPNQLKQQQGCMDSGDPKHGNWSRLEMQVTTEQSLWIPVEPGKWESQRVTYTPRHFVLPTQDAPGHYP